MSEMRDDAARPRVHTTWPPKGPVRRTALGVAAATAGAGAIMLLSAAGGSTVAGAAPPEGVTKVFICKYVGTPGVDEVLQTGQNPIDTSINALPIPADEVTTGTFFNDQQGRSYVLAFDTGQPEPDVSECPPPDTTPSTPPPPPSSSEPATSEPPTTPVTEPPTSAPPTSPSFQISGSTAVSTPPVATSSAPIPAGVSAGLHTPIANAGLKAWGAVLMLLGGASGLLAGLWPTRRRAH